MPTGASADPEQQLWDIRNCGGEMPEMKREGKREDTWLLMKLLKPHPTGPGTTFT